MFDPATPQELTCTESALAARLPDTRSAGNWAAGRWRAGRWRGMDVVRVAGLAIVVGRLEGK